ncbi:generating NADPH oxidase heavy chain subunit [Seminavis robusta]|uniref:Generating NADPH oxidase heavy chain subunit n=1 Tax=Seminavis robusta TaxID=568900 RepID=A0A9N8HZ18_9STRA|nr:generating NADPH oxidase heavy chain subunit [Seminavis robusta]|eukprot:Sro3148_g344450.1 generating NADPH oxidase heavy chain subunit (283) ;mRNA; r:6225-7073
MARSFMTYLRQTQARHYFPFDHVVSIHMILGAAILFWACLHVGGHICDVHRLALADEEDIYVLFGEENLPKNPLPEDPGARWSMVLFQTRAGVTGIFMVLCILVAYPLIYVRRSYFNAFWTSHHLLLLMLLALCVHGTGNLLEHYQSVFWLTIPLGVYLIPRIWREPPASKTGVIGANVKPGGALWLRLEKPESWNSRVHAGMYAVINVPAMSLYEWHPFTLTSSPSEPFIEFHIRNAGDWTNKLHKHVQMLHDASCSRHSSDADYRLVMASTTGNGIAGKK